MNETEQLRDLLRRAVPEAPGVDAVAAADAGRRARGRRRAVTATLAAAACVAAVAVVVPLVGGNDGADPAPASPSTYVDDRTGTIDAYAAAGCPPARSTAGALVPDPKRVTSVRLCVGPGRLAAPADALVSGVPTFFDALAELPRADPGRCDAAGSLATTYRLLVSTGSRQRLVTADPCVPLAIGDHVVDGWAAASAFLDALDRQRDRFAYALPDGAERTRLTCRTALTTSPVRPGREGIEAAVSCPPYDSGDTAAPLDAAALERLREAWAATPGPVETDVEDPEPCTLDDDGWPFVVARTRFGDVVRLAGTDCDRLVLASTADPDLHWQVPVALDDVAGAS